MKKIIILANAFPYGTWEPYLEEELSYLAKRFQVTIFSLMVRKEQIKVSRTVDGRVKVYPIRFAAKWVYLFWTLRVLFDVNFYFELKYLCKNKKINFRRFLTLVVFLSRTHYEKHLIIRILRSSPDFSPTDEVFIYAYRLNYQPYLGKILSGWFRKGRPILVARAHGADLYEERNVGSYLPLRDVILKSVDKVFCISMHGRNYLLDKYPNYFEKYLVSHLGVSIDKKWDFKENNKQCLRITTCSTITEVKRIEVLVDSIAIIKEISICWDHFGTGPLADELYDRCKNFSSNISVTWHGHVDKKDLLIHYELGMTDFILNVSSSEGIPVSMMEAFACGVPVVATNVGGVSEIVKSGANGHLLDANINANTLAIELRRLFNISSIDYLRLSKGAYNSWNDYWRAETNYLDFIAELEKL